MLDYSSTVSHPLSSSSEFGGISEFYSLVRGKAEEFGIEGYKVPRKADLLVIREFTISKAKKRGMLADVIRRSKDPSPTSYSPTHKKVSEEYWSPRNGKFGKARRKSYIDEILKNKGPNPGPCDYNKEPEKSPKKPRFAFIGYRLHRKSEEPGFLDNAIAMAEDGPGSSTYFLDEITRNKAVRHN